MPAEKSDAVEADRTALIILFATKVVPDVTLLITMPNAEYPDEFNWVTPLILFRRTLAFVTSLPVKAVTVLFGTTPNAMPNAVFDWPLAPSCRRTLMSFCEICMLSSKFARIPPVLRLLGEDEFITFCMMTVPAFLFPALAPPESMPYCVFV